MTTSTALNPLAAVLHDIVAKKLAAVDMHLPDDGAVIKQAALSTLPDYRADSRHINFSILKHILRSPAHMMQAMKADKETTDDMRFGTAAHCALLEPKEYDKRFVVWDGGTRRGHEWDQFNRLNAGKEILTRAQSDRVLSVKAAVNAYTKFPLAQILERGRREESLVWTDKQTGIPLKTKIDCMTDECIIELKFVEDARPEAFSRRVADLAFSYDMQAAIQQEGFEANFSKTVPVMLIAIEKDAPHGIRIYDAGHADNIGNGSRSVMANGKRKLRTALKRLAECRGNNIWPGYENDIEELSVPAFGVFHG